MQCPDCGGTHFRCLRCGNEFDTPDLADRIIDILHYRRPLSGYAIAARLGYSKSPVYRKLLQLIESGEVVKVGKHRGYCKAMTQELRLVA